MSAKVQSFNLFTVQGRISRKAYWLLMLFFIIGTIVLTFLGGGPVVFLLSKVLVIFIAARRAHDFDCSGWLALLLLLPLVWIIFGCIDGTHGSNNYGPDPRQVAGDQLFPSSLPEDNFFE